MFSSTFFYFSLLGYSLSPYPPLPFPYQFVIVIVNCGPRALPTFFFYLPDGISSPLEGHRMSRCYVQGPNLYPCFFTLVVVFDPISSLVSKISRPAPPRVLNCVPTLPCVDITFEPADRWRSFPNLALFAPKPPFAPRSWPRLANRGNPAFY